MTFFLAQVRRIAMAGIVALIATIFWCGTGLFEVVKQGLAMNGLASYLYLFFAIAPIAYLLFSLISVVVIRHSGQFAAVHQSQSPIVTFFRMLGHDLGSPFKNISGFFTVMFGKAPAGIPDSYLAAAKGKTIFKTILMTIVGIICVGGVVAIKFNII